MVAHPCVFFHASSDGSLLICLLFVVCLFVCLPVVSEVVFPPEGLITDITYEWSFIRVCSFMNHQIIRLVKISATETAAEHLLRAGLSIHTPVNSGHNKDTDQGHENLKATK